jgi:methylphosphotriester-DNA--protein-cysteine methyltransferase
MRKLLISKLFLSYSCIFKKKTGMTPYEFKKAQDSLQN